MMMLLDTEEIIKRVSIILGCIVVIAGFSATYYFGNILMSKINEGKSETIALKDEATRLNKETDNLRSNLVSNTKDLKSSINVTSNETKKVDEDVKSHFTTLKQFQQEFDKYRSDTKTELHKLRDANVALIDQMKIKEQYFNDQLKNKEQYFNDQIKLRDSVIEKNKADAKSEIASLNESIKLKNKEIVDLKYKLDKEIEWRNKNFFIR